MSTPQQWIDAGYKRFETKGGYLGKNSEFGLQKKIKDEKGIRYSITCYVYDFRKFPGVEKEWGIEPQVRFRSDDSNFPTMNVTVFSDDVEKAEKAIDRMWVAAGSPYYEEF